MDDVKKELIEHLKACKATDTQMERYLTILSTIKTVESARFFVLSIKYFSIEKDNAAKKFVRITYPDSVALKTENQYVIAEDKDSACRVSFGDSEDQAWDRAAANILRWILNRPNFEEFE